MPRNPIGKLIVVIFFLYIAACSLFVPLFNWQYARDNGYVKWVFLGEVVSTLKGVVWPYYIFFDKSSSPVNSPAKEYSTNYPKLNTEEINKLSKVFSMTRVEILNAHDINDFEDAINSYNTRTGKKMEKADFDTFTQGAGLISDYYSELSQSLLISWDSKKN